MTTIEKEAGMWLVYVDGECVSACSIRNDAVEIAKVYYDYDGE